MSVKIESQHKIARAYISVSHSKRQLLNKELDTIVATLAKFKIASLLFVDEYTFEATQEQQMMQQAMDDISKCDLLIAETSYKGIGIGVETGYAKAKTKPIIYVRQKNAEHSTTVSGISDFQIIYENIFDLEQQLYRTIEKLIGSLNPGKQLEGD